MLYDNTYNEEPSFAITLRDLSWSVLVKLFSIAHFDANDELRKEVLDEMIVRQIYLGENGY